MTQLFASAVAEFELLGSVAPKARPRVTANGTYFPKKYQEWRTQAKRSLIYQMARLDLPFPLDRASVSIVLAGKHSRRGDIDNIAGSILDALVDAGILKNDNLMVVCELNVRCDRSSQSPTVKIQVEN